jgi:hypothetical protein
MKGSPVRVRASALREAPAKAAFFVRALRVFHADLALGGNPRGNNSAMSPRSRAMPLLGDELGLGATSGSRLARARLLLLLTRGSHPRSHVLCPRVVAPGRDPGSSDVSGGWEREQLRATSTMPPGGHRSHAHAPPEGTICSNGLSPDGLRAPQTDSRVSNRRPRDPNRELASGGGASPAVHRVEHFDREH